MSIQIVEQGSAASFRETINSNFSELEVLTGEVPPSSSTKAVIGQMYLDTNTQKMYYCFNDLGGVYSWKSYSKNVINISSEQPEDQEQGDLWFKILE